MLAFLVSMGLFALMGLDASHVPVPMVILVEVAKIHVCSISHCQKPSQAA